MSDPVYTDREMIEMVKSIRHFWDHGSPAEKRAAFLSGLMISTGCRVSEIRSLRRDKCCPEDGYFEVINGKGGKDRYVNILPEFHPAFRAYLGEIEAEQARLRRERKYLHKEQVYVFRGRSHRDYISRTQAYQDFKLICDHAGIRWLGPHHGGRTIFISYMSEVMEPLRLMAQVGHANLKTTTQYYVKTIPGRPQFDRHYKKPQWIILLSHVGNPGGALDWEEDYSGPRLRVVK